MPILVCINKNLNKVVKVNNEYNEMLSKRAQVSKSILAEVELLP